MTAILFFKGFIGPYLRGGKMVNLKGYHSKKTKRVEATAGQSALFPELAAPEKKEAPKVARALTAWMDRHGGPAGMARLLADMSPEHQDKLIDAMATIGKTDAATVRGMLQAGPAPSPAAAGEPDLFSEPQHTEPTRELIEEHERLVDVLNSPSHEDDKVEAKKQAEELADMKREVGEHDHLLADIPGAKWRRGKGLIAGHYGVEINGEVMGNYHAKPEDAVRAARQSLANREAGAKEKSDRAEAIGKMRDRLLAGGEVTDVDLKLLGLRDGSSGLEWFIPTAAEVFGISSRSVRPHISDMIRIGHTDMGVKKEFVSPKKALRAVAAGLSEKPASESIKAPDRIEAGKSRKMLSAKEVSFQNVKDMIGRSLSVHEWDVDNGGKVKAQVKTTTRGGEIKTAYLHVTIEKPNGYWEYYREKPDGGFKMVSSGVASQEPSPDSRILLIKPIASADLNQASSKMSNNSPEATAKEKAMDKEASLKAAAAARKAASDAIERVKIYTSTLGSEHPLTQGALKEASTANEAASRWEDVAKWNHQSRAKALRDKDFPDFMFRYA